jgi:hypothetical protein
MIHRTRPIAIEVALGEEGFTVRLMATMTLSLRAAGKLSRVCKQPSTTASLQSMSLLQREQVILETVRHYANLAHHVDNKGSAGRHGRADATFLLAPATSAVTRACARARIVSPGAGE